MKLHANVCSMGMDKIETIACYRVTRFGYCFHVWTNQNSIRYR